MAAPKSNQKEAPQKGALMVEVLLLKTVQLEPGKDSLLKGKHEVSSDIAEMLIAEKLATEIKE